MLILDYIKSMDGYLLFLLQFNELQVISLAG